MVEKTICAVCGTENTKEATHCVGCGIKLHTISDITSESLQKPKTDDELDNFVKSFLVKKPPELKEEEPAQSSTLIHEEQKIPDLMTCPMCNNEIPIESTQCPYCKVMFEFVEEKIVEEKPAPKTLSQPVKPVQEPSPPIPTPPPPPAPVPPPAKPIYKPPAQHQVVPQVTRPPMRARPYGIPVTPPPAQRPATTVQLETDFAKKRSFFEGKLVDILIIFALVVLFGEFILFRLWEPSPSIMLGITILPVTGIVLFVLILITHIKTSNIIYEGDRALRKKDYNQAISIYNRAIKYGISTAIAWTNKGIAYKKMGRLLDAIQCHDRALQINPHIYLIWSNKGDVLLLMNRAKEAELCYKKALELNPRYEIAWNNLGVLYERWNRLNDARECFEKAVQVAPRYSLAWRNLGNIFSKLGNIERAQFCFSHAGLQVR